MWQVEMQIGDGFENVWHLEGEPEQFETKELAEAELAEFLNDQAEAFAEGFIIEAYDAEDFRVVEVQ